jgi:hypothetical protein
VIKPGLDKMLHCDMPDRYARAAEVIACPMAVSSQTRIRQLLPPGKNDIEIRKNRLRLCS